jgi:hypothetical protein
MQLCGMPLLMVCGLKHRMQASWFPNNVECTLHVLQNVTRDWRNVSFCYQVILLERTPLLCFLQKGMWMPLGMLPCALA